VRFLTREVPLYCQVLPRNGEVTGYRDCINLKGPNGGRVALLTVLSSAREFFIDNLLVRIHFIIVMMGWTGLAPWESESPFPGSLTSKLCEGTWLRLAHGPCEGWLPGPFAHKKPNPIGTYSKLIPRALGRS